MKLVFTFLCLAFLAFANGNDYIEALTNGSFYGTGYETYFETGFDSNEYTYEEWVNVPKGIRLRVIGESSLLTSRDDEEEYDIGTSTCAISYRRSIEFYNPFENNDLSIFHFLPLATEAPEGVFTYFIPDTNTSFYPIQSPGNITYTVTLVDGALAMFDFLFEFENYDLILNYHVNYTTFDLITPNFSVYRLPSICDDIRDKCTSCITPPLDYYASGILTFTVTNLTTNVTSFIENQAPFQIWHNSSRRLTRITVSESNYIYSSNDDAVFTWSMTGCSYNEIFTNFEYGNFLGVLSNDAVEISPDVFRYQGIGHSFTINGSTYIGNATYTIFITNDVIVDRLQVDVVFQVEDSEYFYQQNYTTFRSDEPDLDLFSLPTQCAGLSNLCSECTVSAATALLPTNLIALALLFLLLIQIYQ